MGLAVLNQAKHIQKLFRGFKARKLYRLMVKSMKYIKENIRKFIRRRRFRKAVLMIVHKIRHSTRKL
jgi:myosin heavy subunit